MRTIAAEKIRDTVAQLCLQANFILRPDVLKKLKSAHKKETRLLAKKALDAIIANVFEAQRCSLAICQDTGLPSVFVDIGQEVNVKGNLKAAINKGVESGYKKGYLRNSVIRDPLLRGRSGFQPAIIHIDIVSGSKIKLTVLPKGFGCENKTQLKMFKPTADIGAVKKFIVDAVRSAGADACPPYVVGVGIGGSADYAVLMAKKALLRRIGTGTK
ncbi:MAG: fumarate hydratase, partial [Candidatus Omnitrophica bacterium]|nr:fumarate hydratase [Candidatus Omnitrophota bacterium]